MQRPALVDNVGPAVALCSEPSLLALEGLKSDKPLALVLPLAVEQFARTFPGIARARYASVAFTVHEPGKVQNIPKTGTLLQVGTGTIKRQDTPQVTWTFASTDADPVEVVFHIPLESASAEQLAELEPAPWDVMRRLLNRITGDAALACGRPRKRKHRKVSAYEFWEAMCTVKIGSLPALEAASGQHNLFFKVATRDNDQRLRSLCDAVHTEPCKTASSPDQIRTAVAALDGYRGLWHSPQGCIARCEKNRDAVQALRTALRAAGSAHHHFTDANIGVLGTEQYVLAGLPSGVSREQAQEKLAGWGWPIVVVRSRPDKARGTYELLVNADVAPPEERVNVGGKIIEIDIAEPLETRQTRPRPTWSTWGQGVLSTTLAAAPLGGATQAVTPSPAPATAARAVLPEGAPPAKTKRTRGEVPSTPEREQAETAKGRRTAGSAFGVGLGGADPWHAGPKHDPWQTYRGTQAGPQVPPWPAASAGSSGALPGAGGIAPSPAQVALEDRVARLEAAMATTSADVREVSTRVDVRVGAVEERVGSVETALSAQSDQLSGIMSQLQALSLHLQVPGTEAPPTAAAAAPGKGRAPQ